MLELLAFIFRNPTLNFHLTGNRFEFLKSLLFRQVSGHYAQSEH